MKSESVNSDIVITQLSSWKKIILNVLVAATPGSFVSHSYVDSTGDCQITGRSRLINLCEKGLHNGRQRFWCPGQFCSPGCSCEHFYILSEGNKISGEILLRDRKIPSKCTLSELLDQSLAKTCKILAEPMSATDTKLSTEIISFFLASCYVI